MYTIEDVDKQSKELIAEFQKHFEDFREMYDPNADRHTVFEGWVIQKIAGIQVAIMAIQSQNDQRRRRN